MKHWTDVERELAVGKTFALIACFGDNEDVSYYVYEKHDILAHLIDMQAEYIHSGIGYASYDIVDIDIHQGPFMVIERYRGPMKITYYATKAEALEVIKNAKKEALANCFDSMCFAEWVCVDLQQMRPYFVSGVHARAQNPQNSHHFQFLRC